jgi:hypothetical protein
MDTARDVYPAPTPPSPGTHRTPTADAPSRAPSGSGNDLEQIVTVAREFRRANANDARELLA